MPHRKCKRPSRTIRISSRFHSRWALLVALCGITLAACGGEDRAPLSAVLITIDTTNPGALDCYETDRGITPRLRALAEQSLVFDTARTVAPLTLPSHASMLTGLYPLRHSVRDNGLWPLPDDADTLAERAQAAGYQTAAFVSAVVLSETYGLAQGFEVYDEPQGTMKGMGQHMLERSAKDVTTAAQRWLRERAPDQPFFLWVHYFDPHAPYEPEAQYLEQAGGNAYLGEVAQMDAEIGNLLDALEGEVGLDRMLVTVVADHGESLGRHREPTHSVFCYDATMAVPLLVRLPEGERAGERNSDPVSVVDVFPTFLERLPWGAQGAVDGRSLLQPTDPKRGVYVESYCGYLNYGWSGLAGWADARGKYLHSSNPELFFLEEDPQESNNRFADAGVLAKDYQLALRELAGLARLEPIKTGTDSSARMRAVGYAGAGSMQATVPEPLAPGERPAPNQSADELDRFYRAAGLAAVGKRKLAIESLRPVLESNPGNVYAADVLAGLLVEERRFEEARAILLRLLEQGHDRYSVRLQLGTSYEQLGDREAAQRHFEGALGHIPGDEFATQGLQRVRKAP